MSGEILSEVRASEAGPSVDAFPGNVYLDGKYLEKNPLWHVEESPWKARQILHILEQNRLSPKTICEVGCGAGEVLKQLQAKLDQDCTFQGYEISPQAFEMAKTRANERLRFKMADIAEDKDTCFDLILVLDVIEHLEDYFSFLRVIKPRSRYKIFHIPLDLSAQAVLRKNGLMKRRNLHAHLHYFTKETALETLKEVRYEVLDWFYAARSNEIGPQLIQKVFKLPRALSFAIHRDLAVRILGGYSLFVLAA